MTDPSSTAASQKENDIRSMLKKGISICLGIASLVVGLWLFGIFDSDPYVKTTLALQGSMETGEKLFRVNCVGCHGISAQGLLGPDLHEVSLHLSEKEIINQVIQGKTPPMPRFQMEPQQMSDLLVYLHSLN
ncbi:cytochrome c [Prochlorococcus sp. MIT 1307]|uniref:cytochrome c n=1 Tax=Prochlorococcus sp. MIT 1307 TaxID=3096219 RepID=UPI002A754B6B|nr:cytochrome c [Prochlorococcus sp. MIT 1307]